MSFDGDEEILQDFLVEAGEILEVLSEQLVDLENRPDDADLLNAIFRGFHTVKGGAGFLQLDTLVDLCHAAENIFDLLRNGKLSINAELMDVVLQALDAVNSMFEQVHGREYPDPADPALMTALHAILEGDAPAAPAPAAEAAAVEPEQPATKGDITDEEFEQFLDALDESGTPKQAAAQEAGGGVDLFGEDEEVAQAAASGGSDEITEDEFEALLDQLHGKGKFSAAPAAEPAAPAAAATGGSDEITDDEFESLLDELHGKGKHGGIPKASEDGDEAAASGAASADLISDDEFESLLDELHGKGKGPTTEKGATAGKGATAEQAPSAAKAPPAAPAAKPAAPQSAAQPPSPAAAAAKPAAAAPAAKKPPAKPVPGKEAPAAAENTVRVDTKRLDDIMNMVGELVLVRNRLVRLGLRTADEDLAKAVANLDVVTGDLQTAVMKTRMQPIKKVFGRFPRVVRDLARNLKKEITLELEGEETDLDKNLVEALADPLVHLVRNSVDHGIEAPDVREQMGKPRMGKVFLAAEQEGDHIVLSITDDGGGMDPDMLRRKAVEKGLMDTEAADRLSDPEAFNLIFHPGFSTKEQISDVSGRGVGMDVVKTKITQLNGTIDVHSEKGVGTRIAIKVPLTLAIMPTLMVMLGTQAFALPLVNVNEIFHLDLSRTNVVDGQEVVVVREKALPLFHLKRWLIRGAQGKDTEAHVVIVSVGTQKVGFVVDQLIGQEEVVIKPLGKMLHGTPGMAGATITGDGRIALILDIPSMLKAYAQRV
ncbi:chemotaxis protein CheA [Ketobacter sp.]|uniref:chemotaxis protein CheA n=1 Tax=Ketobacter sp. TaxID=2083498 RepID=UPI000F22717D|nr:chemotaxis protein CheA [Ketobacter sp.]RLU00506.1 MAG: chemotaxis protein CheA [Ketobacter sp.]